MSAVIFLVPLLILHSRQRNEKPHPNLLTEGVIRPMPIPQTVPIPRADQHEHANHICANQHRKCWKRPSSGLSAKASDFEGVRKDEVT